MKKILILIISLALGALVFFQWKEQQESSQTVSPIADIPALPAAAPEPRFPIPSLPLESTAVETIAESEPPPVDENNALLPESEVADSLPALNESNAEMKTVLSDLFDGEKLASLFYLDEIVRRFVVSIDNLTNKKLPRKQFSLTPVAGVFQVENKDGDLIIAADNAARYAPLVTLATQLDAEQLVMIYVRYYALFQEAYAELSLPNAYFNDRLVDVLEHLLQTPVVDEPIHLVQPKVFYQYADADLESRSAGQKILLRMGNANAEQIKTKLREIRRLLIDSALLQEKLQKAAAQTAE